MKNTEKNNVGVSFIHRRKILRIYSLQKLFFMQVFVNPIISCEIWPYTSFIPDKTRKHNTSNIAKKHATENVHIVNFLILQKASYNWRTWTLFCFLFNVYRWRKELLAFISPKYKNAILEIALKSLILSKLDHQMSKTEYLIIQLRTGFWQKVYM